MRPEVDMHAGTKKPHAGCGDMCRDNCGSCRQRLEDVVRVVGVAELALSLPIVTCTFEIVANCDVYHQIGLPRHADVADFEIGVVVGGGRS